VVPESVSHFIGGRQVRSALGKAYGVADPATGKDCAQVEVGTAGDVIQAVLAAQTALETGPWPGMAAPDRARILHAIADAIDALAAGCTVVLRPDEWAPLPAALLAGITTAADAARLAGRRLLSCRMMPL
jgi:acyl-CoA reductase-like NAD-dependent aldehyde dehydrogenase